MATVQRNYHVSFAPDKSYYSVPFEHIGKQVKIIASRTSVEIYYNQTRIAVHLRVYKEHFYQTQDEHMPANHNYKKGWTPDFFISKAQNIGTSTQQCIEKILNQKQYPEQNYKSCMGVLQLASKTSKERLENACIRALKHGAFSYTNIKNIIEKGLDKQEEEKPNLFNQAPIIHENIRGAEYFNE